MSITCSLRRGRTRTCCGPAGPGGGGAMSGLLRGGSSCLRCSGRWIMERQFDALLLSGDPTTYKPLLKHLADAKDFVLTWLDNAVLIFRRPGAQAWKEADLNVTAGKFQGENRARFLSGAATRLMAIGQLPMARRALDAAGRSVQGAGDWTALALYDGEVAQWKDAMDALDRRCGSDADFTPALTTKAQILFGARRYDEALEISDKVVEEHPDDPSMLFLQATISHQAHAYQREIAALKHLIELAEAQGQSTTGYRIYLGQAYANTGEGPLSLIEFKKGSRRRIFRPSSGSMHRIASEDWGEDGGTR